MTASADRHRYFAALAWALIASAAGAASAKTLVIAAPDLPPMIDRAGDGREATIVRETLAACGHDVGFHVVPFSRHWQIYRYDPAIDAVTTVPTDLALPGYPSGVYIQYQNGASTLQASRLKISTLGDLTGRAVASFPSAKAILPGLEAAAPRFASYQEFADQLTHSKLLFARRIDAVLADGLIFAEYGRQLILRADHGEVLPFDPHQPERFTAIFPPTPYVMAFRDQGLRDDFDRCFATLSRSGRIDAINRAVVSRYRDTVGDQYLGY
ncbi:MAG: ABC transporter substrate-binding protein [Azospirillum sp.]|nr:ABC transporter substrate-binding protein [Azospirillum sp.]